MTPYFKPLGEAGAIFLSHVVNQAWFLGTAVQHVGYVNANGARGVERKDVVGKTVHLLTHKPQTSFQLSPSESRHQLAVCASVVSEGGGGLGSQARCGWDERRGGSEQ